MRNKTLFIFLALFWILEFSGLPLPIAWAAQNEKSLPSSGIELQGISYDSKNPPESIAIINGGFFKKGDLYRGFTILEVKPTTVIFEDLKGQQSKSTYALGKLQTAVAVRELPAKNTTSVTADAKTSAKVSAPPQAPAKPASGGGDIYGFHALKKARSSVADLNSQTQKKES